MNFIVNWFSGSKMLLNLWNKDKCNIDLQQTIIKLKGLFGGIIAYYVLEPKKQSLLW